MGFLIDTCIWIDVEQGQLGPADISAFTGNSPVYLSPVTLAELHLGIEMVPERHAAEFGPRFGMFGDGVLGYEVTEVVETFLQIGVGRLVRDITGNYEFSHPDPVAASFPVEVTAWKNAVSVSQRSAGAGPLQYLHR